MPTLHWIGKEKIVTHHQDVPYRVLKHTYGFTAERGEQEMISDTGNKIIRGDNLEALKALLPEYEGKIKCIYIDPPYNTGNEKWVYNDNVNHPKIKKWLGEVVGKEADDLTRHDKWLCMMYPRLKLLYKLLSNDGVIFVSIDDNESASLKLLLDEIFTENHFFAKVTWINRTKPKNMGEARFNIQQNTEDIYAFGKVHISQLPRFNLITSQQKDYPFIEDSKKYRLELVSERRNIGMLKRDNMVYELLGIKNKTGYRWQLSKEKYSSLLQRGLILLKDNKLYIKYFEDDEDNFAYEPFWSHLGKIGTAEDGKKELNLIFGHEHGFETVKPIDLIKKLLFHSTKSGDIILDSFAGSGTTGHAVMKLNAEDGGNRKFILIEMEEYAETITAERNKRVIQGYGEGEKKIAGLGGGFDFYELGESLFVDSEQKILNEEVGEDEMRKYVYYTETGDFMSQSLDEKNKYFMGKKYDTGYYFYYEKDAVTTLDEKFLATLKEKSQNYLVYADTCTLSENFMRKHNILFKKIPRDITKI